MLIMGIDPGSRFTGWGLVEQIGNRGEYRASGTLKLGSGKELPERLLKLADGLEELLRLHRPDHCAIEKIFNARNTRSALVLGHARGVILCAAARGKAEIHEYSATQIKQAVTGMGRADKGQIQKMVAILLGRNEKMQEDEADALAVALTHAGALKLHKML